MSANDMTFSAALAYLKQGRRVARKGWNGNGMWLILITGYHVTQFDHDQVASPLAGLGALPWIGMKTADGMIVPWLCSQTDMLAEDWELLNE